MIQPTQRCVYVLAGGMVLGLLPVVAGNSLWIPWLIYTASILIVAGFEAIVLAGETSPHIEFHLPPLLYIGTETSIPIVVHLKPHRGEYAIEILCDCNELLQTQPAQETTVRKGTLPSFFLVLKPLRRGIAKIEAITIRWTGPIGLFRRYLRRDCSDESPVVPNYHFVRNEAFRFFGSQEHLTGLKIERYIGEGSEFERLQEFVPGLDHRSIDWKASAHHRRLLCREFRAERNHQIILAIDTGYIMCEPLQGMTRLDHAINIGLFLSYVSLWAGDRVGLFAFDQKVQAFLEPRRGAAFFPQLQTATSKLTYANVETNYTLGIAELSTRLRQRALVVVVTDFVDTVTAELMVESLDRLSRRHLVLFVSMRDRQVDETAHCEPSSLQAVAQSVIAAGMAHERDVVIQRLRRKGILVVDETPVRVSTELINHYLDIKRREMIT